MQLTTQMRSEIETIRKRLDDIDKFLQEKMIKKRFLDDEFLEATKELAGIILELNPYKVRLENILCETDSKEQVHCYLFTVHKSDQNSKYTELGFLMNLR